MKHDIGEKISVCMVVYNEEHLMRRCLESVVKFADEIIVVHDGPCSDETIAIAKQYTPHVFVRDHVGVAEPHRSFTFEKATHPWIFQIDADEYIEPEDVPRIRVLIQDGKADGYYFRWELWNGKSPVHFTGLKKLALFKKERIQYQGIPQTEVSIRGKKLNVGILLHHQPVYSNVSWKTANKKRRYWLESHVRYFFPEDVTYACFGTDVDSWVAYTKRIRRHPVMYMIWYPLKNLLGQLKNGLVLSYVGWNIALQQYIYYVHLYWRIWKKNKEKKSLS